MTKRSRLFAVSTNSTAGVPAWRVWLNAFVFVTAVFLAGIDPGFAQVNNWIGPNGDWSTVGNWSLGVPVQADSVVVDNGTTATVDKTFTIQNLTIGASTANSTVQIPNGVTLNVAALTIGVGGTLSLADGGGIFQSGGFTNNGNFIVNSGSINVAPITGTGSFTKVSALTVTWDAPLDAGAHVFVNGGTFIDRSTSLGNVTVDGPTSVLEVNAGVTLSTGLVLNNAGTLTNSGTGTVSGPGDGVDSTTGGATVNNQLNALIQGGTGDAIRFNDGGTVVNNGRVQSSQNAFAGVFVDGLPGSVTNSGSISGNSAGIFLNAGGTVNNLAGGVITGNHDDGVFVNNATATVTNSGTITGPDGVRFQVSEGTVPAGTITNNAGGIITGVNGVGVGTIGAAVMDVANSGTINGGIGILLVNGGTITNNAGASISGISGPAIQVIGAAANVSNEGNINGNVILGDFANSVTLLTGGAITGTLNVGSAAAATLTLDGAGSQLLSQAVTGTIGGFNSLTKLGTGTWVIDENLSYGGSTTIILGTLQIGNGGTAGSVPGNVLNNGVLSFDRTAAMTFEGVISGGGSVTQNGSGIVTLTGTNSYAGGTNLNAGIVAISQDANLGIGPLNFNSGTLEILAVGGGIITGKAITLGNGGGRILADSSTNSTLSGVISGFGGLVKDGTGQVTLTASNTYSGGTSINGGTVVAAADSALGTGIVTVNDLSILRINPGVAVTNFVQINNAGTLDNFGNIQVTQTRKGPLAAVTTSGGATITNESGATISGVGINGIQNSNGSLSISNSGTISGIQGIALGGNGNITNNANGVIAGSSGIAILASSAQTSLYNAGTINGNVALGNFANSAQLITGSRINGVVDLGSNPGASLIFDGAGTQSVSEAVTGGIKNAGFLTKQGSGTWTIDTILNAPISTKILDGILEVNGSLQSSDVTVQPGGTLKGVGNVVGNVLNFGILSPGNSPGTLTVNGNFSQGLNGVFNVEILSGQNYSRLVVTGHASLDGTLHLTLASGFRPTPGESFTVLSARQGISGTFRTISSNTRVSVTYANGVVNVNTTSVTQPAQKAQIHLSDGTPDSTTALLADYTFYGFGSLSERMALGLNPTEESGKNNAISLTFDAGEFDFQGQHGQTYTIPIAGGFKINERVRLDYEIPLQYITLDRTALFQGGLTLDLPVKVIIPSVDRPWSWIVTPTAAFASSGSREIIGGGALTNVLACQWHGITATYGNYISFFEGEVLTSNDPKFPTGVSQQIMKNGLRLDVPIGKSWIVEGYGIYTQFFQPAAVGSYVTFGAEVGYHFAWNVEGQNIDFGYLSLGMYSEIGNRYSSGHVQIGSAWRF
jgi:fibronectin-binding autotransporter adhesin